MKSDNKDRKINTSLPVKNDGEKRLPHERDEAPDAQDITPRPDMQQAASDLEQGLVDTDLHGERGVEKVAPAPPRQARPQPETPQSTQAPVKPRR
jgi:hypothetical protein